MPSRRPTRPHARRDCASARPDATNGRRAWCRAATGGIVGIAVLLGAVLVGQDVAGWIVGLVIGLTSVILAALLWSSRQL